MTTHTDSGPQFIQTIVRRLREQRAAALELIAAIPETRLAEQPAGLLNHPAWTLGHLHISDGLLQACLGKGDLKRELFALCGPGSMPKPEVKAYLGALGGTKDAAIETTRASHAAAMKLVEELSIDDFARETSQPQMREWFPTVGDVLAYLLWHEGHHEGQLSAWRRAAGLAPTSA